ncbi:FprA family A-type flavoprotein [Candidatus Bipolaricaulota bacterium]|nr:FprA family A-type flavoprotein [Candidatus Bipolaricaulota bacterium]
MIHEIKDNIYWVGVNDRRNDLFESYWPIPDGISYNSYLIKDEKTALIDGVKVGFAEDYLRKVESLARIEDLDYVIINHMEPDHTGVYPSLRRINPEVTFVGTEKARGLLESFYGITQGVKVVETDDFLDLGSNTLEFLETPFIHWPETMMTYLPKEEALFSGDGFGTFGALNGGLFDDQLDVEEYLDEAIRYLSNIVGAYSATLQSALANLKDLDIEMIAPAHGPIWREKPERIVQLYDKYSSGGARPGITIVHGSMYGFTEKITEQVARGARSTGLEDLKVLDASRLHPSYLLSAAWKRRGLIVGSPTYESRAFPPINNFLEVVEKKKLKDRIAGIFGSYGWGGGSAREIKDTAETLGWNLVTSPVEFNGKPSEEQLEDGFELGKKIAEEIEN